jgi:hypothetical protein
MKFLTNPIITVLLLRAIHVFAQLDQEQTEETLEETDSEILREYFPAVAVASFTGPSIIGEFNFFQDTKGQVVATGAIQKGLKQDLRYKFTFYDGPNCEELGEVLLEHEFSTMRVVDMGGTPPVQESIPYIRLTGEGGYIGAPWVLSDSRRNLACVILKGHELE